MKRIIAIFASLAMILGFSLVSAGPAQALTLEQTRQNVINRLNAARATKCGGATTLAWSDGLTNSAQFHANDMATNTYFGYDTPFPYETWDHRISRIASFNNLLGENIDHTSGTPETLVNRMLTPNTQMRQTALNCHYKVVGVGYAFRAPTGPWWTVDFSDKVVIFGR